MNKPDIVLGIDPGKQVGFAIYSRSARKLLDVQTLTFWEVYDVVTRSYLPASVEIVIENPAAIRRHVYARLNSAERGRDRIAANVGANRRDAELLIERFEALGYTVRAVAPIHAKKWTHEEFQRFTHWPNRVSQHCRDAARLVWGL